MGRGRGQGVRGAVQALCVLLRNDAARTYFGRQGGVAYLTKIIRMQVSTVRSFRFCLCVWWSLFLFWGL